MPNQRIASAPSVARARPVVSIVAIAIVGVTAGAVAGSVNYLKNPTTPAVSSPAVVGQPGVSVQVTAPSATSAAVARQTGFSDGTNNVGSLGASASAVANDVTLQISSTVSLTGVSAAGAAHALPETQVAWPAIGMASTPVAGQVIGFVAPVAYEPLYRIMRNTPVPALGIVSNDVVATSGTLFPDGITPVSKEVLLSGVSAQCVAVTVSYTRNVRNQLTGASSAARAGTVSWSVS